MLLAIDIGNTHTVIGVYAGDSLRAMWRIATNRKAAADELRIVFSTLFSLEGLDLSQVRASAVASVVPQLTKAWMQAIKDATGALSLVCNAETAAGLFDADYPNPREIGADRVADAVAARALYGAPVVVVDFGTATNIEVIDRDGRFRGGVIAPGVQTSANALFTHGAQLPDIALVAPPAVIGTNTVEAIQSGIMLGEADRVDGLVRRIFELKMMVINGEYTEQPLSPVSDSCAYAWEYVVLSPVEGLYRFALTDEVLREFERVVESGRRRFLRHECRSLEILEVLTSD